LFLISMLLISSTSRLLLSTHSLVSAKLLRSHTLRLRRSLFANLRRPISLSRRRRRSRGTVLPVVSWSLPLLAVSLPHSSVVLRASRWRALRLLARSMLTFASTLFRTRLMVARSMLMLSFPSFSTSSPRTSSHISTSSATWAPTSRRLLLLLPPLLRRKSTFKMIFLTNILHNFLLYKILFEHRYFKIIYFWIHLTQFINYIYMC